MHCIKTDFRDHWKDLYMKQRNWGYGKSNNVNNIPEFMSLELNCDHSTLYSIEYNFYINPVLQLSKTTCHSSLKVSRQEQDL